MSISLYLDPLRVYPIRKVHNQEKNKEREEKNRGNKMKDKLNFWEILEKCLTELEQSEKDSKF